MKTLKMAHIKKELLKRKRDTYILTTHSAYDFHLGHRGQRPLCAVWVSGRQGAGARQALFLTSVPYSVSLFSLLQVCEFIKC